MGGYEIPDRNHPSQDLLLGGTWLRGVVEKDPAGKSVVEGIRLGSAGARNPSGSGTTAESYPTERCRMSRKCMHLTIAVRSVLTYSIFVY